MRIAATLMMGLVLAAPAMAQQAAAPPPTTASYPEWEKLTPEQRQSLVGPVRSRWNDNPDMRDEMLKRAQHWQRMSPEQRQSAQRGMKRWENLTPEQRKAMHEQWKAMSPEQRKAWLDANGPKTPSNASSPAGPKAQSMSPPHMTAPKAPKPQGHH
ncbi:DUF3106 domain-containing protein [Solilutibacter silvestris]|uniref:DUF3106 domain-containing protein n=1 Tax=Solilutibacter silvestris TaxID=1645665 RepID=A0A2K1PXL8_9GAMM|nr:DUF3106 domain-containing protein [Lysobacter silvestris]PNS07536.1 hypothetical protein Lysil_1712 [Lysobacter silvestris]